MAKIRDEKQLKEWASEWLNKVTLDIFDKTQENIDYLELNYTGQLKKSGTFILDEKLKKSVVYTVPYAYQVEFGSDASLVPIEPLKRWVRLKTGKPESFAYYVQWKIENYGIEPKGFIAASMTWAKEQYR